MVTGSAAPIGARNDIIDLAGTETKLQLVQAPSGPDGGVDFAAAVAALRELGYRRILCEGGPRLFAAGLAGGAVDELCLTVSPMLTGPDEPRIVAGEPWPAELAPRLRLVGLLTEDSALFCRYLIETADRRHPAGVLTPNRRDHRSQWADEAARTAARVPDARQVGGRHPARVPPTSPSGTASARSSSATATRSSSAAATSGR